MAKIQIEFEKLTLFGGFFSIMELFCVFCIIYNSLAFKFI